jgi:hypothetical protein
MILALSSGCCNRVTLQTELRRTPKVQVEHQEFSWGKASVRVGMTKDEVLEQIKATQAEDQRFGPVMHTTDAWQDSNTWKIPFGSLSGPRPDGGAVFLIFVKGRITKIEIARAA